MAAETSSLLSVRLAELVASLSIATDLGMGQPLEFAIEACILSMRLGEAPGMSQTALREVYYQGLLRYIGCNVDTALLAAIVGDEMALRRDFARIDNGSTGEVVNLFLCMIRQDNAGAPTLAMVRSLASGILTLPEIKASFARGPGRSSANHQLGDHGFHKRTCALGDLRSALVV